MRTDLGTENSIIAFVQPTLRGFHQDELAGEKSFHYGKSTSNQVCTQIIVLTNIKEIENWSFLGTAALKNDWLVDYIF